MEDRKYLTIALTVGGVDQKFAPMAQLLDHQAGTSSEVRDYFFQPLTEVLESGIGFTPEWSGYSLRFRVVGIFYSGFLNGSRAESP